MQQCVPGFSSMAYHTDLENVPVLAFFIELAITSKTRILWPLLLLLSFVVKKNLRLCNLLFVLLNKMPCFGFTYFKKMYIC